MAVSTIPGRSAAGRGRAIVFVHGFTGTPRNWEPLIGLLAQDPAVREAYDLVRFEYETPLMNFRFDVGVPTLKKVAERLASLLGSADFQRYHELTLVGHSQGGLVIERYLVDAVGNRDRLGELERIRQVILFATPNLGSALFGSLRGLLSFVPFLNRQEKFLRALNDDIGELQNELLVKVLAATAPGPTSYPIPFVSFYGTEDAIVPKASAAGHFRTFRALKGNHHTIITPDGRSDERFQWFKEALDDPWGHIHTFEVDEYENHLAVQPHDIREPFMARHGDVERAVHSDNVATLTRSVRFSNHNQCDDHFEIRYGTRDGGFIKPTFWSHENEASLSHKSFYDDYGTSYTYQVRPVAGATYKLSLAMYRGFDEGNRQLHFHLRKRAYIKKYRCILDLRAYVGAGFTVSEGPRLYFEPRDYPDHAMCDKRVLDQPRPCLVEDGHGLWTWEIENVRFGIVDLRWNVAKPS